MTANAGNDAMIAASGKAGRGQGVYRMKLELVISDATPMVIDAWKNAQTVKPTKAKTA